MIVLQRLLALLAGALLVASTLPSCAGSADIAESLSQPVDSTIQRQLHTGKVKFKGNVTIQLGAGNINAPKAQGPVAAGASQAQDYSKAAQHGGALGTGAKASTATGVPPWLLGTCIVLLLFGLLAGLAYKFRAKLFRV